MRRRRTAAPSPDLDALNALESPSQITEPTEEPLLTVTETAAEPPKPRRTRRKTIVTAEADPVTEEAQSKEPIPVPVELPAEPETPAEKPRRTRRPRTKAEPEAVVEVLPEPVLELVTDETVAEVVAEPETELVVHHEIVIDTEAGPVVIDEVTGEEPIGEGDEPAEEVVAEETASEEATAAPKRGRRPRRRGKSNGETPATPVAETPVVVAPTATPITISTVGAIPVTMVPVTRPGRIRGPKQLAVTPTADALPLLSVIEDVSVATETAEKPKRTRGTRKTTVTRIMTPDGVAVLAAPVVSGTGGVVTPVSTITLAPLPTVYQPLSEEVLSALPEAKIEVRKGVAELLVNGEAHLPIWFFVNTEMAEDVEAGREIAQRQIRYAYKAGVRTFTILAHLPWKTRSGDRRYDALDDILNFVAENAPDALILPRLMFSPTVSWERTHASDMIRYDDDSSGDVSLASRSFWEEEAVGAVRATVEHVAQGPHAGRVFGFYLEHGEWFHEKGRGFDLSEANVTGFQTWLKARYKNNLVALRSAWYDGAVTFETAEIPSYPPPTGTTLFYTERERRWVDFHEYSSDIIAQVILRLGKTIKEASRGRSAVAVSYGYTMELCRAASGHLALGQILESPDIDILTGPHSYAGRHPGGSSPLPLPVDSVTLAGKLFVSEDDTKTYLAGGETPDSYNPKISTVEGTRAVHARNFGAALSRGCGISWMDLWGEGWLDDEETWQALGKLVRLAGQLAERRLTPSVRSVREPDVAVIVDEKSFFCVRQDENVLGHLVGAQRDVLLRSGARLGFYLLSDLLKDNFPQGPRLLLFLNAFHIPIPVRTALTERYQRDGRTLAFLYGPGCQEGNPAELTDALGMQLRLQPWGSKAGTQIVDGRSPLTDGLRGAKLGEEKRCNPSFYVSDSRAQVFGEYVHSGNPSVAIRKHARWQSVFIGEMSLTLPLLRGLYRVAGVPVVTVDDDVAYVTDNLICLHSAPGGGTTVYLPEEGVLYDLWNEETLATDGYGARLAMPIRGTRLLFYGTETEVAKFGGDPKTADPGLTEEERLPVFAPFVFEAPDEPVVSKAASVEDAILMEAALTGDLPVADKDSEASDAPVAESATDANKKRRRRRRGRGRGTDELLTEATEEDADTFAEAEGATQDEVEAETAEGLQPGGLLTGDLFADLLAGITAPVIVTEPEAVTEQPVAPRRPSLDELLPLSTLPEESELPPIPDEFLPMNTDALLGVDTGEADGTGDGTGEGEGGDASRRPRYRRPRRPRRPQGEGTPPSASEG